MPVEEGILTTSPPSYYSSFIKGYGVEKERVNEWMDRWMREVDVHRSGEIRRCDGTKSKETFSGAGKQFPHFCIAWHLYTYSSTHLHTTEFSAADDKVTSKILGWISFPRCFQIPSRCSPRNQIREYIRAKINWLHSQLGLQPIRASQSAKRLDICGLGDWGSNPDRRLIRHRCVQTAYPTATWPETSETPPSSY